MCFLLDGKRWPNADHLAGVSAECGLKAILLSYFGAALNQNDRPFWGQPPRMLNHVDSLWKELPLIVGGRTCPVFSALITGSPPPFATWDIADRYGSGNDITEQRARGHAGKAKEIVDVLEQAILTGVVP